MRSERVTDLMAALEESLANAKAKQRRKDGEPMGQPLTLDEIGVAEADAAQVIYDLRRRCTALEDAVREVRDVLRDRVIDWRKLLAVLFDANEHPMGWSFPHGDAGGLAALVEICAFCDHENGHADDCPWEAARVALGMER